MRAQTPAGARKPSLLGPRTRIADGTRRRAAANLIIIIIVLVSVVVGVEGAEQAGCY